MTNIDGHNPLENPVSPRLSFVRYCETSSVRSLVELSITIVPFVITWVLMLVAFNHGYWIGLLLAVSAAGFLVRLFMIQHDCSHRAFFRSRIVNDWIGRSIGVVTMTPYAFWRSTHALHHASSGNLDRRGIGDIDVLTVREFVSLPRWRQASYRLYRHPVVMFGLGPIYLFILQHRIPKGMMRGGWRPWLSTMGTNLSVTILVGAMILVCWTGAISALHLPIMILAASIGVWLFYIQHQFENTFWARGETWNFHEAALYGSSHYDLPRILQWFTANIGIHHIHHLSSKIPFYRLPDVLRVIHNWRPSVRSLYWEVYNACA